MEADMLHSAGNALLIILDPLRMLYLVAGVCMGLALGILPGIGGVAGLALLLPFTFSMDPYAAFAFAPGRGFDHDHGQSDLRNRVRRAWPRRIRRSDFRRLFDDQARRGRAGAWRVLHVGHDRRHF